MSHDVEAEKRKVAEGPLNRKQQRYKERVEQEASQTYSNFTGRYFQLFINSTDPEGPELQEVKNKMNAQWKMYCTKMQLVPAAKLMFEDYCKGMLETYQKEKQTVVTE